MMTINELLNICMNVDLIDIIISNVRTKGEVSKIKIRPIIMKDILLFQASQTVGTKVIHNNYSEEEIKLKIEKWMIEDFKQAQITTKTGEGTILSGKNGNMTIKYKNTGTSNKKQAELLHNRSKKYILEEGKPVGFLIDLGVMTADGKIVNQKYDKFKQINRFLEFIEDILPQLDKKKEQTIIDFGCGKSYLTFAMYYYLKVLKEYDIKVIGLDLKEDVIATCNSLKDKYSYDKLNFFVGDIASYKDVDAVDMVVTLHACDTATDYAMAKAVTWGAKVILSVPCCQHEANKTLRNDLLAPVFKYGILKERMAAIFTDAIRAELLESKGYKTQILEFIDMEHTPKNLLIRAIKQSGDKQSQEYNLTQSLDYMQKQLNLNLTLNQLFEN
ncbi:class I SAM-dependent methyltransferase [[Clostridium] fimetarium]